MKRWFFLLLSFAFLSANALWAESVCPWLTQGSAAAMLGGDVSAIIKLTLSAPEQGSCAFSLHQGAAATYSLEVVVESTPRTTCPPASPKLLGIGNEAVACRIQRSPNEAVEVVSSRVRTLYFTIGLTTQGTPNPSIPLGKQKDIVERAAEQVAGNLD
jgi:hypothetical protein